MPCKVMAHSTKYTCSADVGKEEQRLAGARIKVMKRGKSTHDGDTMETNCTVIT
jgi:hypothetical protein